jgi:hypothetical protein
MSRLSTTARRLQTVAHVINAIAGVAIAIVAAVEAVKSLRGTDEIVDAVVVDDETDR